MCNEGNGGQSILDIKQNQIIKVAHILDGRHFGGAEQMVRRLMQGSPAVGVQATAYCLAEGRLADFLRQDGLPLRVFPSTGRLDFRMLPAMLEAARQDGIQIMQAHTSRTHLLARLMSTILKIPNITTIQSPIAQDENKSTGAHPWRAWIERLGRPWTHQVVPVSQEEGERLVREEHLAPTKLTWIPNGMAPVAETDRQAARDRLNCWLKSQNLDPEVLTIVMIAQMRPRKGPETLIEAFAHWTGQGGRGNLIMIGDDEFTEGDGYLNSLKLLAQKLNVIDHTIFTGFMNEPWSIAAGADLFVLPSLFGEGLPLVLLEAMNYGLPISVSDTLGNRELVVSPALSGEGDNGWIHPPGDAQTLATHLAAAGTGDLAAKGAAGRNLFLWDYTLEVVMNKYRCLYAQLLQQAGQI